MENAYGMHEFNEIFNEPFTNWTKKLDQKDFKDGMKITIHQRKMPGYSTDMLRVDATFQGISMQQLLDYFIDPPPGKMEMMKESRILEKIDEYTCVKYQRIKMPMMSDRDQVLSIHHEPIDKNSTYIIIQTVEREDCPEVPGAVRMSMFLRALIRKNPESPEDTVDFTEINCFNMKGYMPGRLLNMVIASEASKEMTNMYKYLASENKK